MLDCTVFHVSQSRNILCLVSVLVYFHSVSESCYCFISLLPVTIPFSVPYSHSGSFNLCLPSRLHPLDIPTCTSAHQIPGYDHTCPWTLSIALPLILPDCQCLTLVCRLCHSRLSFWTLNCGLRLVLSLRLTHNYCLLFTYLFVGKRQSLLVLSGACWNNNGGAVFILILVLEDDGRLFYFFKLFFGMWIGSIAFHCSETARECLS